MIEKYDLPYFSETIKNSDDQKLYESYEGKSLLEIFEELDAVIGPGGAIKDRPKYKVLIGVIADKFELIPRNVLEVFFWEEFGGVYKRLDELETIAKTHRHRVDVAYGEKPI